MSEAESTLPCAEKLTFDSKVQAEDSAVTIKWQRGIKLKPYLCKYCDLWHLTSN